MPTTLGSISVMFNANTNGLMSGISTAKNALQQFASGDIVGGLATTLVGVGAAAIGVGVQATKMAADFQTGLTSLVTGAGESQSALKMVGDGILSISTSTGTTTQQLTSGMYQIESATYHGAAGLDVLRTAAEGAKVGNADLGTVAGALTTVLTDYHMKGEQATQAMNAMIATTAAGKMKMQDLAGSMGSVLPLAASLGINFANVGGAIATMTNQGMSAQRASMNLANAIRSLAAPGSSATKAMNEVGLSAQQLHDTLSSKGLDGAIQLIQQHINEKFPAGSVQAVEAFKKIMGGATGYNVALMLGGKNMSAYEGNIKSITDAMNKGGSTVNGWAMVQGTFNEKMDEAKAALSVLMIQIGQALLPVVTKLMGQVIPLIGGFASWITQSGILTTIAGGLSSVLSGVGGVIQRVFAYLTSDSFAGVIADFQTLGNQVGQMLVPAFEAIGPIVSRVFSMIGPILTGVVIPAIDFVVFQLGLFAMAVRTGNAALSPIAQALQTVWKVVQPIGAFLASTFVPLWRQLVSTWQTQLLPAITQLFPVFQKLLPALEGFGIIIGGVVALALGLFTGLLAGVLKFLASFIAGLVQTLGGVIQFISGVIQFFTGFFSLLNDLFSGNTKKIQQDFALMGSGITSIVSGLGSIIQGLFKATFGSLMAFTSGFVQGIIGFFTTLYNVLVGHSIIPDMVNAIVQWFAQMPARVMTWIEHLVSNVTGAMTGLASQALTWGSELIGNLISGIESQLGNLGNMASNIAGTIAKYIHFSKPDTGPLARIDAWMPDMGTLLAQGLTGQSGKLSLAASTAASALASPFGTAPSHALVGGGSASGGSRVAQPIIIEINGQEIARAIAHDVGKEQQRITLRKSGRGL